MPENSESQQYKGFVIYANKSDFLTHWVYHAVLPVELRGSGFPSIERTWAGHSGSEAIAYAKAEIDQKIGDRIVKLREELTILEKING